MEEITDHLDCIKNLQGYPGTENVIKYAIANLVADPEFNELFSSWCRESLNQNKSKNMNQNPDDNDILNRMEVLKGISTSLDCIKNLQDYPGAHSIMKYAIMNLVGKSEFNELLISWWNFLKNKNNSKYNQNPDWRDIPNRITTGAKCKQNMLISDKTAKIPRLSSTTKPGPSACISTFSSTLHHTKDSRDQNKSVPVFEAKASGSNSNSIPITRGVKRKQNVLITDKSAKIPASSGINKDKPQLLKTRLSSTTEPGPFACISEFSSFLHHIKAFSDQNKAVQTPFSEAKASSSNLNGTPITSGAICKQNIHITDKTGKIPPSQTVTKNKPRQLKTRSSSTTEAGFSVHISKDKKKAVQTTIFEAKASRSNSNSTPKLAMTHLLGPHYLD